MELSVAERIAARHMSRRGRAGWLLLLLFAGVNSLLALRYLMPHVPFAAQLENLTDHRTTLTIHATSAALALLVGPFALLGSLRARRLAVHRWLGRIYCGAVFIGGLSGIRLAAHASAGPIAGWGFFLLATAWLTATGIALRRILQRRIRDHRRWMLRSYALTAAAITLRIYLPLSAVGGVPFPVAYRAIAWLCWIPNLIAMEMYLQWRKSRLLMDDLPAAPL